MSEKSKIVDGFIEKQKKWGNELALLRSFILECGLTEDFKWGNPCYTLDGGNVVLIHSFKEYCALLFFKGAIMNDPNGVLIQQTEKVQAARHYRFTASSEISDQKVFIKACVLEAIRVEKAGLKVELKKTDDFEVAEEFQKALDDNAAFKAAFEKLTPGRQRAYLLHFAQPKQSKTRLARIEKHYDRILEGKGLND